MTILISGTAIIFSKTVLNIFDKYRQKRRSTPERGGILLGSVSAGENTILIERASLPGQYDTAMRNSFVRDKTWAQGIVEYEFLNSEGRTTYLGEWHTHPVKKAMPSKTDLKMIGEQIRGNDIHLSFLLMVIVGTETLYIGKQDSNQLRHVITKFEGLKPEA